MKLLNNWSVRIGGSVLVLLLVVPLLVGLLDDDDACDSP